MQVHLNAHSGLRPFACDRCDKTFRSNAALKKHLRIHSLDRPFACSEVSFETLSLAIVIHQSALAVEKKCCHLMVNNRQLLDRMTWLLNWSQ